MIRYFKMKYFIYTTKMALYDMCRHSGDVIRFLTDFAASCQELSGDDLRREFMDALAGKIHESNPNSKKES